MPIRGEVAVVTGASSGIGAALARQLAARGFKVGLTSRRLAELEAVAESIRSEGGTAAVAPADAADPGETREALGKLAEELGPIDLLVANAGLGISTPAASFSAEAVERMVRVNLVGASYAIEAVLPEMLRRGRGHLVGVSSLAAYRGLPGSSGYCATKAGLSALLEGLRPELHPRGIAVTTVHPGFVRTPMTVGATHPQPFLMDVESAARVIVRGIVARRRRVDFPMPMVALMTVARLMPGPIYDRLILRLSARDGDR